MKVANYSSYLVGLIERQDTDVRIKLFDVLEVFITIFDANTIIFKIHHTFIIKRTLVS